MRSYSRTRNSESSSLIHTLPAFVCMHQEVSGPMAVSHKCARRESSSSNPAGRTGLNLLTITMLDDINPRDGKPRLESRAGWMARKAYACRSAIFSCTAMPMDCLMQTQRARDETHERLATRSFHSANLWPAFELASLGNAPG